MMSTGAKMYLFNSSKYINLPILQGAFETVYMEALNRLGISWDLVLLL